MHIFKFALLSGLMTFSTPVAMADTCVLVALGDSLVQGYGLYVEDGFVPQLEKYLTKNSINANVVNAGVSGDTSSGGLARLDWVLSGDVNAVLILLGGNDLLRGIFPEETRKNLDQILGNVTERELPILLIGHEAPDNFGPEYKKSFEQIFVELSKKYQIMIYPRFFAAIETEENRFRSRQKYLQEDFLHPNAEGVRLIVDDLGPLVVELLSCSCNVQCY